MGITVYNDQMLNNLGLKLCKYFKDETYSNTTKLVKFKYTKFYCTEMSGYYIREY